MEEICIKIPDELKIGLENTKLDEEGATELGRHLEKSRSEKLKKEGYKC